MKMKQLWLIFFVSMTSVIMSAQHCYWQQEVSYDMDIDFDVKDHTFTGNQSITYTNNSPDVIDRVFYHLYFNAFQPGSMMDIRNQLLPDADARIGLRIKALKPNEEGHLHADVVKQDGRELTFEEAGTILEVELATPLNPGEETVLEMEFHGQVPVQIRRSGRNNAEGIDYSMSQWYPKLCAYDYMGWHANPYIGREFYGNWGDFNVSISIDKDYVVAASGVLQNPEDIGYGYADVDKPNVKKGKITYNFLAENVHDFVWAADPDYKHVVHTSKDGTEMHFFYQEGEDTEAWTRLPEIMADAFPFMNENYGEYPYPVYSFIQGGDGGMEYPMATLITGNRELNSLVGVSVHELFHSWYQLVLGTDEARFAWMDEGFTVYGTTETMNYLRKKHKFGKVNPAKELHTGTVEGFMNFTNSGMEEPLTTHSDHFGTNAAYSVAAYVKGCVYLVQMRYIIGEDKFKELLLEYYNTWRFKHPEPQHLLRIAEKLSGLELDWFHQYFINTTKTVDYGLDTLWDGKSNVITFYRLGEFPMPLDFKVDYMDGTTTYHTIPLRIMRGAKQREENTKYNVEPDWPWTNPYYEFKINLDKYVKRIELDPSGRLMDKDKYNNVWERP